jgi:dTDP-4-dehydrorhamnose 3,5-epimerase
MTPERLPGSGAHHVSPIEPPSIRIVGAKAIPRTFHQDPRGFLVETLRSDDDAVDGARFRMSYTSLTLPGQFRDVDRWHVHKVQSDRFVVVLGEMTLALFDARPGSATYGWLDVVRMTGAPHDALACSAPRELTTHLVPIPPGVLHCIGNLDSEPFLLQNFPTELYSSSDEGRIPFASVPVPSLGRPFAWDLIVPRPPKGP